MDFDRGKRAGAVGVTLGKGSFAFEILGREKKERLMEGVMLGQCVVGSTRAVF